ncbi:TetR/AcrR family transcriptional regulator [Actinomycetospora sp. NBRC 106375]|uniref:TetR/AcrR family transcriptional regulator n=1 Tax=Actinomycetospora sp. NBRC 106375 TaxID=3032207 RepID=UPI0025569398|nr:TetR/AcrR family transcriptional regulator [Actinomycetospora sp. NBRC 106375]
MTDAEGLLVRVGPGVPTARAAPTAGKRAAIVQAATALFLAQGYRATSTEQIAAAAAVSKQTVYNQFADKSSLFAEIVLGVSATADAFVEELGAAFDGVTSAAELEPALRAVARRYLAAVGHPQVLALRRLVISEAARFPELAATYWARTPSRVLAALAGHLAELDRRGLLSVGDPAAAADDLAFLLVGRVLDEGMFHPEAPALDDAAAARRADHAVDVFLAAHPPGP